jgi:pilus assembly protein Flp/PilA
MKNYGGSILNLLREEDGVTAVEYAVLFTLVVVICLATMATAGVEPRATFAP